jgi:PAS domain S-box-containing protein
VNPSVLAHVEAAYDGREEAIAVLDESLRVRAWSAAMESLSGLAPEAVQGVLLYDLYPELWGTPTAQLLTDALHGEYGHIVEPFFAAATPVQAHGAEAFVSPLVAGGKVTGCLLRARDRARGTAEQHEEAAIDQRFRAMADAAPVLLWKAGTDSLCDFFNQTWLDFSGRRMQDELGVGWAEGVHPEDFQRCMNTYTRAFSARQPFEMEYRLRRHDGEYRWLLDRGVPRFSVDGTFVGFIGSCVDITDRIAAERAARDLARDLGRANQQMEQLLYAASHDLHEPIRMVTSFLELLERHSGGALDDKALRYLRFAREGGIRMGGLVDGLLTIARARSAKPALQPVDTRKLVDLVLGDLASAVAECGAQVNIGELPIVTGDPALLRSLLQNLLSNAIKFRSEAPPTIRIAAERRGDEWEFSVQDNGIGFRSEDAPRVFELFRRLHPRAERPGNGIGLALAREIVLRHGGRIWARSEVGKGATLSFSVPVVA